MIVIVEESRKKVGKKGNLKLSKDLTNVFEYYLLVIYKWSRCYIM